MELLGLPSLLTVEQVAEFLRIDVVTAYRAAVEGELPVVISNGRYLVDTKWLLLELGISLQSHSAPRPLLVQSGKDVHPTVASWSPDQCWKGAS